MRLRKGDKMEPIDEKQQEWVKNLAISALKKHAGDPNRIFVDTMKDASAAGQSGWWVLVKKLGPDASRAPLEAAALTYLERIARETSQTE
jgi:hypothetical protein